MSRRDIYYWKCDRPAAFHGTDLRADVDAEIEAQLREALTRFFKPKTLKLSVGTGQGNHLTWNASADDVAMFIRVENGPENDDHLAVESAVLDRVRAIGVPTPLVLGCDATRREVPFAWQALEHVPHPDLNQWLKQGVLDASRIAIEIGASVAKWQSITFDDFGVLEQPQQLRGCHARYEDYFHLRLGAHLGFLVEREFLNIEQSTEIESIINDHRSLLQLDHGVLVHKDLALWNILGTRDHIAAFIDYDDAISGDPMDDLSLLACFHDAAFVQRAIEGYQSIRALPDEHRRRFWLHLLRNLVVKSVIRVGAGYFERDSGFFLISAGSSGADLKRFTQERLQLAIHGLVSNALLTDF